MQRAHILGIGGVFMSNLALLLKDLGWQVSGSDRAVYPPVSRLLDDSGIAVLPYDPSLVNSQVDCFVIGNSVSRGNPLLESILNAGAAYQSGPALLSQQILADRQVIAVAGTHGKTSTSSMLVHLLHGLGIDAGYLIGGSLQSTGRGSHLGSHPLFVVEADEYDSAFCDKRAKFVHYRPRWAVINNLEFDHADIYPDLAAIETQFHHLVRLVPGNGAIVYPAQDQALARVIQRGVWCQQVRLGEDWRVTRIDGFWHVQHKGRSAPLRWQLVGAHQAINASAALAVASCAGVNWQQAAAVLESFVNAERRMQRLGSVANIRDVTLYTDFAHHPTAIAATLSAMRESVCGGGRLLAILHPASNTMRREVHQQVMPGSLAHADLLWLYQPDSSAFDFQLAGHPGWQGRFDQPHALAHHIHGQIRPGDCIISLSNGDIEKVNQGILQAVHSHAR